MDYEIPLTDGTTTTLKTLMYEAYKAFDNASKLEVTVDSISSDQWSVYLLYDRGMDRMSAVVEYINYLVSP